MVFRTSSVSDRSASGDAALRHFLFQNADDQPGRSGEKVRPEYSGKKKREIPLSLSTIALTTLWFCSVVESRFGERGRVPIRRQSLRWLRRLRRHLRADQPADRQGDGPAFESLATANFNDELFSYFDRSRCRLRRCWPTACTCRTARWTC